MLTPEYIDHIPDRVLVLYQDLEDRIIKDMARRISLSGEVIPTTDWQLWKLQQMGEEREYIQQELAKLTGQTQKEMERLFEEAGEEALSFDDSIYRAAGLSPTRLMESRTLKNVILSGIRRTNNLFFNLTATTANTATKQFESVLDNAWLDVTSGAFSYQNAITSAVKSLSGAGIDAIVYPSGHTDKIDVAVRRAVLTGVNQTAGELSYTRAEEMGCDLVETTAHMGARLSHTYWQGRVFSRSGKSTKYPDFISETGYGTGPGLCGWNCRHSFYPFFEGISERMYTQKQLADYNKKDVTYNGEKMTQYDASQKQRYIERNIRKWKREYIGLDAAGLDTTQAGVKLSEWNGRLSDFLAQTGRKKDYARTRVIGFGKRQAGKASSAAGKKDLTSTGRHGTIKPTSNLEAADVHFVGKIDKNIYKCVAEDIKTDEVIITDERIRHIKERHPNDYEEHFQYVLDVLQSPDYILEANKPNTAFILKHIEDSGKNYELILKLKTSAEPANYKNSIITFLKVENKRYNRYLRTKKILYKLE